MKKYVVFGACFTDYLLVCEKKAFGTHEDAHAEMVRRFRDVVRSVFKIEDSQIEDFLYNNDNDTWIGENCARISQENEIGNEMVSYDWEIAEIDVDINDVPLSEDRNVMKDGKLAVLGEVCNGFRFVDQYFHEKDLGTLFSGDAYAFMMELMKAKADKYLIYSTVLDKACSPKYRLNHHFISCEKCLDKFVLKFNMGDGNSYLELLLK